MLWVSGLAFYVFNPSMPPSLRMMVQEYKMCLRLSQGENSSLGSITVLYICMGCKWFFFFLYTEQCHLVFQQVLGIPGFLFWLKTLIHCLALGNLLSHFQIYVPLATFRYWNKWLKDCQKASNLWSYVTVEHSPVLQMLRIFNFILISAVHLNIYIAIHR